MGTRDNARRAIRKAAALGLYRSLLNLTLLVTGFNTFPGHQTFLALAVLAFSQGIYAVGAMIGANAAEQNHLSDIAERKTRHTILLAQEDEWRHDLGFWAEVDRRVAEEVGPAEKLVWSRQLGAVALSMLGYFAADITTIVIATMLAGG